MKILYSVVKKIVMNAACMQGDVLNNNIEKESYVPNML